MGLMFWILTLLAAVILSQCVVESSAYKWGNYYRIETEFVQLSNPAGIIANGKYCDAFTKCDPRLYAFVDVDAPLHDHPGSAARGLKDFHIIFERMDANITPLRAKVIRNVCGRALPQMVNVRVEAFDYDYWTRNDVMDVFQCVFPFKPTSRSHLTWSQIADCHSLHQPSIKLSFHWRIIPIHQGECNFPGDLQPMEVPRPAPREVESSRTFPRAQATRRRNTLPPTTTTPPTTPTTTTIQPTTTTEPTTSQAQTEAPLSTTAAPTTEDSEYGDAYVVYAGHTEGYDLS